MSRLRNSQGPISDRGDASSGSHASSTGSQHSSTRPKRIHHPKRDASRFARLAIRLPEDALSELEFAARLHDVGKIQVPDAVLNKPGPLEPHENDVIRCHASWGSETLSRIPGLEAVATIVRFHHERWDGAGYPDGLSGSRIPLASRIIAVCDAYGAMTCDRPYRAAMPADDALTEIRAGSGSQFDPSVVRALMETLAATV